MGYAPHSSAIADTFPRGGGGGKALKSKFKAEYFEFRLCSCPSFVCCRRHLPPKGKALKGKFKTKCFAFRLCNCPSFVCCRRHLPPGGKALKEANS